MAFDNDYTAVTGATYQASDYNTGTKGNFTAVWVGTTAGDLDYYTSATAKNRLALVAGGLLYGGASAPAYLPIQNAFRILMSSGSIPVWASLVQLRQGGDANNWQTGGTSTITPSDSLLQPGVIDVTTNSSGVGSVAITYPMAFAQRPIILATVGGNTGGNVIVTFSDDTVTGCTFHVFKTDLGIVTVQINWLALGEP